MISDAESATRDAFVGRPSRRMAAMGYFKQDKFITAVQSESCGFRRKGESAQRWADPYVRYHNYRRFKPQEMTD